MKNLIFSAAFGLVLMFSCKSDTTGNAASGVEPGTPSVEATTKAANNQVTPADNPFKQDEAAVPVGPVTSMTFAETEYDFGTVTEGEKVKHVYKFTNSGSEPLIISNAKATCGCTVPEWPREPVAPGDSGELTVVFDTKNKGKVGGQLQTKRVTITANTDPVNSYVNIKGKVERTAAQQAEKDAAKAAKTPG